MFGGTSQANRNARMTEIMDIGFGNAPATVRLTPPPPVALDAVAANSGTAAPATAGGAGKTIRVAGTRAMSPRPMRRPEIATPPAAVVAEVKSGVAEVLASLQTPEPAAPEPAPAALTAVAPPPPRPETVSTVAVTAQPPAEPQAPLPFALVDGDGNPISAPGHAAPETALAETDLPDDLPAPVAEDAESMPESGSTRTALVVPELTEPEKLRRPRARPGEIVMTTTTPDITDGTVTRTAAVSATGPLPGTETVARVSTSGGRHWAVTLGKFANRGTAERALLQTALSETRALEGALRKVVQRGGAWEATFAGLTQDQADLACRRLQARAIGCFTLGP